MSDRLYTVETGTSAQVVAKMLRVLFPDARTVCDLTFGSGSFWRGTDTGLDVTGIDINPARARDVCADFTRLPFRAGAFDVAIFDPPYHTDMGRGKASVMGARFGAYGSMLALETAVCFGCAEAQRVSRLGVIVKVQDYIHGSQLVEMTQWVRDHMNQPVYQRVDVVRPHKLIDPKWGEQLSAYSNSATFLAFRHGDQRHIRRRRPLAQEVVA